MGRSKVVLPQPEGPRKQTNSPSAISSEISPRAVKSPKRLERFRTSRCDIAITFLPRHTGEVARRAGGGKPQSRGPPISDRDCSRLPVRPSPPPPPSRAPPPLRRGGEPAPLFLCPRPPGLRR